MSRFRVLALLILCGSGLADDARLDALRTSLIGMRGKPPGSGGPRGATPQLTVAKHQLRDWVQSQLSAFARDGNEGELERRLSAALAKQSCFAATHTRLRSNGALMRLNRAFSAM